MREDLYRGKRIDNGEWIYWNRFGRLTDINGEPIRVEINTSALRPYAFYVNELPLIDEETVGQYTGLTDKNGKKIFEGDIIKDKEVRRIYMIGYNEDLMEYAFLYYHKELKNIYCGGFASKTDGKSIEVIGNIHDNFELLAGE